MKSTIFITLFAFFSLYTHCAYACTIVGDSVPPIHELYESLQKYHAEKLDASMAEYSIQDKYTWMKWTPSLGLMYNLQGQPRPSVNFSLNQAYSSVKEKDLRAAKVKAIKLQSLVEFKTDSLNLSALLQKHQSLKIAFLSVEAAQKVDDDLWELTKQKYENKELTPSQFLTEKRQYIERSAKYNDALKELDLLEIDIKKAAKW
jgi:hypothetical protein